MDIWFYTLTTALQSFSNEALSLLTFGLCITAILFMMRFFQAPGLLVYNALMTIIANIQVLKVAQFGFSPEPVALGTIAFATIFLTSDILTEHYGSSVARHGVGLCFIGQVLIIALIIITLGHTPINGSAAHQAMEVLFLPSPRLLIASLSAFAISQLIEITVFNWVSKITHRKMLWLRTNVATLLAALLDNIIFSTLAWVILAPTPVTLQTLVFTYILGTYFARILVSILSTPVMYLSYLCIKK